MSNAELTDHSPHQPVPAAPVATASNLILIDNYDSFTWNVYQYLVLEGANATVYRNDEITLEQLVALKPTQLVISPGPGHPLTDSGISKAAIEHFAGKIPIFGVCMGEQCIFSVFGGTVSQTGEILHGKTSPLRHDGKGLYAGLSQDLPVTRYHSLAGTHSTLPESLELTSWIAAGPDGGKGVIMGVRHKEYTIEGVQFHPESILSAEGRTMIKNFMLMQGGTWAENEKLQKQTKSSSAGDAQTSASNSGDKKTSILERIYTRRRELVEAQKVVPSLRPEDLQAAYDLDLSPPSSPSPTRASPSKGIISLSTCAPAQARTYALAGASVISVLTEPDWFKGSIDDMRAVRQALAGMPNRPAVLRKEFIFDEYQILEARVAGADTFLLIVKMLDTPLLERLYKYGQSLGMEAVVEVNTTDEMEIAVKLGSKVIGVNNRNLTTFDVDMDTTNRLMEMVPEGTTLCALSGITGPQDVEPYLKTGVGAVLVGEALMRAKDTTKFISELLGGNSEQIKSRTSEHLAVKICGTRSAEAAKAAIEAGADLIGMILVTGRKRCVSTETALTISQTVHNTPKATSSHVKSSAAGTLKAVSFFEHKGAYALQHPSRALIVGVFQNQPLDYVLEQQRLLNLDIVQLHGQEPLEWASIIPVPVIRAFKPNDAGLAARPFHSLPLLDSGAGGTGEQLDLSTVVDVLRKDDGLHVLFAGGLNPDNVAKALQSLGDQAEKVVCVDVSSGVETDGEQDLEKIKAFVKAAKASR
ncbi:hypothetical protein Q7P35_006044 [Cladosporium inversicolor]